jgi:hypothetical protein
MRLPSPGAFRESRKQFCQGYGGNAADDPSAIAAKHFRWSAYGIMFSR